MTMIESVRGASVQPCERCEDPLYARRLCRRHYNAWYRDERATLGGPIKQFRAPFVPKPCRADDCERPSIALGLCRRCYGRLRDQEHPRDPVHRRELSRAWVARNRERSRATHRKSAKQYRAKKPDQWRENALPRKYGITPADYDRLLEQQGGHCAICSTTPKPGKRLDVDHDHATNAVRGLVCRRHNMGMGYFADEPAALRAAADYLEAVACR